MELKKKFICVPIAKLNLIKQLTHLIDLLEEGRKDLPSRSIHKMSWSNKKELTDTESYKINRRLDKLEADIITILESVANDKYIQTVKGLGQTQKIIYLTLRKIYLSEGRPTSFDELADILSNSSAYRGKDIGKYQVKDTLRKSLDRLHEIGLVYWQSEGGSRLIYPSLGDILRLVNEHTNIL